MLLTIVIALQASQAVPAGAVHQRSAPPTAWVAFAADLKITHPDRPDHYGRYVQDEHGCSRRETVHPDGSLMVAINNFDTQKFYQLIRGTWTVRSMRVGPFERRPPPARRRTRKADPIEGFEAWITTINVRSPRGDYVREATIIPALNDFEAIGTRPNGEMVTALNIRRITQPAHSEFLPPPHTVLVEREEPGGFMAFSAVVVRTQFDGVTAVDVSTIEETPAEVRTPSGEKLAIVTTILDHPKNLVRVRVMKDAVRRSPGRVDGEVVEEVLAGLGESVRTTGLVENFSITVVRVGGRIAR